MSEDIRLETNFEHYISRKLQELSDTGDWQVSQNDDGFDPNTGLVMDDFVAYINAVSPQKSEDLDDEDYEPFPDPEDWFSTRDSKKQMRGYPPCTCFSLCQFQPLIEE